MTRRIASYRLQPVGIAAPQESQTFDCRRDLVAWIDSALRKHGFSVRARRQVDVQYLWRMIQTHGSSRCGFLIECQTRNGVALRFIGT